MKSGARLVEGYRAAARVMIRLAREQAPVD